MRYSLSLLILSVAIFSCKEKQAVSINQGIRVSSDLLREHTTILASDEYEGRGAGYPGEKMTAEYIATQFASNSLVSFNLSAEDENDYFFPFDFYPRGSAHRLATQNVIGFYRGNDQPDEYIIVGAHHDGQGKTGQADFGRYSEDPADTRLSTNDSIWNSAVDNAVSISAIIEMARVLKEYEVRTKRSIIFATFSAEESGLDGSVALANNPPVPVSKIKAMINLEKLVGDPEAEFLYVSYGSSQVFQQIQNQIDSVQTTKLTPFFPGIIADTDHYAFLMREIPAITVGTGSQTNVHTPLDHADKLNYKQLKERVNYILSYIIKLANSESDFSFTGDLSGHSGVLGGPATDLEIASPGLNLDAAFKVTSVIKGSRGYKANIQAGDLIVSVDNMPLNVSEDVLLLEDVIGETRQQTINLKIVRENDVIETKIVL